MAIDAELTNAFKNGPRAFLQTHLLAVRGMNIPETVLDVTNERVARPRFPAMATSPAPDASDRTEKNYAITTAIVMAGGIEKNTQYDGYTNGRTRLQLNSLRIEPMRGGAVVDPQFKVYFLPYADNLSYTMQLDSAPDSPRFFCTEAINGCTFQVAGTVDKPVVTHANVQGVDLTQEVKAQFLEFFLEPARVGAARRANSVIAARLQRFSPSATAVVDPASVVEYGAGATASFDAAVNRVIGRSSGVQRITKRESGVPVTYEYNTVLSEMNGKPLDVTGGEVAVIGDNPSGRRWRFFWSMYVPVKVTTMCYRLSGTGARVLVDSAVTYDFIPVVSGRFLWPDWYAGTPQSIRAGHLGV